MKPIGSTSRATESFQKRPRRQLPSTHWMRMSSSMRASRELLCFGRTKSGRLLTVLYAERGGKVRVVTAYEMTKPQQHLYFQER